MERSTEQDGRQRERLGTAVLLALTIALGLASRGGDPVPALLAAHAGDALWTVAVHLSLALVVPRARPAALAAAALGISWAVELSQLCQASWLVELRSRRIGSLLLGTGWQWLDLPRYAVGAALAWALDRSLLERPRRG